VVVAVELAELLAMDFLGRMTQEAVAVAGEETPEMQARQATPGLLPTLLLLTVSP
jgi:hypothetical protein